jgi:hypothetical protein
MNDWKRLGYVIIVLSAAFCVGLALKSCEQEHRAKGLFTADDMAQSYLAGQNQRSNDTRCLPNMKMWEYWDYLRPTVTNANTEALLALFDLTVYEMFRRTNWFTYPKELFANTNGWQLRGPQGGIVGRGSYDLITNKVIFSDSLFQENARLEALNKQLMAERAEIIQYIEDIKTELQKMHGP